MSSNRILIRGRRSTTAPRFVKWSEIPANTTLEGTFTGIRVGDYGPLATLKMEREVIEFPCPVALEDRLSCLRQGAEVTITYLGKQENKRTGRTFHAFKVFADAADQLDGAPGDDDPPF